VFYIFNVYTEISVWSWKFVLKSWKSHGNPLVKMCKNPGYTGEAITPRNINAANRAVLKKKQTVSITEKIFRWTGLYNNVLINNIHNASDRVVVSCVDLTNLRLGHHGGFAVTQRRERETQLCFFIPLKTNAALQATSAQALLGRFI